MFESKVKVLLVDDHRMVLDSLSMLLSKYEDYQVVATFTSGHDVLPYLKEHPVDLIITDSRMPEMEGTDLCRQILNYNPDLKVIMISMIEDSSEIRAALGSGVKAYLPKSLSVEELLTAIREVLNGKRYLSNDAIVALNKPKVADVKQMNGLTIRELEITKLIAQEYSTGEIAERLCISVPTVETHRKNLFQKTGVKSAIGLVLFAIKNRLLN